MNTENNNQDLSSLSTDMKRALALRQFKGMDYFFWHEVAYEGKLEDAQEQFSNEDEDTKEGGFDEYVKANFVEIEEFDDDLVEIDNEEYYVLTDSEADDKWDEYLDNYIDDVIMSEMPKHLQNYFDDERWKEDARYDGRGHSLASYDGHENEETIGDETFYIYRHN